MLFSKRFLALAATWLSLAHAIATAQSSPSSPGSPSAPTPPTAPAPGAPSPGASPPAPSASPAPSAPASASPAPVPSEPPAADELAAAPAEPTSETPAVPADDEDLPIETTVTSAPSSEDEDLPIETPVTTVAPSAEDVVPDTLVVGRSAQDLDRVPGVVNVVTSRQLEQMAPFNANEVLRRVPGVTVREEEGVGLRANIGIHGLNADRSRNVLVLEDGVPVQVMPYSYPELYYTPRIDRMRSVEVVKGSGSVLFGPQTLAGVVNFVTLDPPEELNIRAGVEVGNYGLYRVNASVGDTVGNVGYLVHATNMHFAGNRGQDVSLTDLMAKLRIDMGDAGVLRIKLQGYFEDGSASYLGLTTQQFATNPAFNFVRDDRISINRFAATVSHGIDLGAHVDVQTTAYASINAKDWGRQNYSRTQPLDPNDPNLVAVIDGAGQNIRNMPSSTWRDTGEYVYLYNTRSISQRQFRVTGVESRATYRFRGWGEHHRLIAGMRLHYEDATTQGMVGASPTAEAGTLLSDYANRAIGYAAYGQLRLGFVHDKLEVTPGIRLESVWVRNETYLNIDPVTGQNKALAPSTLHVVAPIPGVGASFAANEHVVVYGGVHRGFAPPRLYDALTLTGVLHAQSQLSWNYELGVRLGWSEWFRSDVSTFALLADRQAINPSEATNGMNADGTAIEGKTRSLGVEVSSTFDLAKQQGWKFALPLTVAYTYLDARTVGTGWNAIYQDIFLPYVPQHQLNVALSFSSRIGIEAQIDGDYRAYQYSDLQQTVEPDPSGTKGLIPARFLLNARVAYHHRRTGLTFSVAAKNLLDAQYIATRAPAGIFPGMFRQIIGGVSLDY